MVPSVDDLYEPQIDGDSTGSSDEAVLQRLRKRYSYASRVWLPIREESQTDRRYLSNDPWSEQDKKARADRPCINHDELNQYINQATNFIRSNPRGIQALPSGNGATEKSAEFRENLIRGIEYKYKGTQSYITAFEQMVEGSYGFFRLGRKYVSNDPDCMDESIFNQEISIGPIPNQDSVLYDPDCKELDWSDARYCFVLDPMPHEDFKEQYPNAQKTSFSSEDMLVASDWIAEQHVLVAEYWEVTSKRIKRYLLDNGAIVDRVPKGAKVRLERSIERKRVTQYLTNGIEILERTEQPGTEIPIIVMAGKQRYLDEGGTPKRILISLPRFARDPQLSLAYLSSQQMEEAGLTPKVPYIGYVGQFQTDEETWHTLTRVPHAFAQVDPIVDGATGQVLPLPQRQVFTPNFAAYEVAKDSARRAIQAAMGISPLPTAAERNNEKSGVALDRIETARSIGTYHFIDNYNRALERAGRIVDSWIGVTYDTEREVPLHHKDDTREMVRINTDGPYVDAKTNELRHYPVDEGDHDITISTGPSNETQREAAGEFLDTLISTLPKLPLAPPQAAKLLALSIQMKQLGPKGDEMAEIIAPPDQNQMPPQAQQAMAQAQQQMQALMQELQQLRFEKQARVVENEYRMKIERMKIEAGITEASIEAKTQDVSERREFVGDMWQSLHDSAHDQAMQSMDHAHEQALASQQAQQQAQQQTSDQQHQQTMAEQQAVQQQQQVDDE
jgi:hypothetical protein